MRKSLLCALVATIAIGVASVVGIVFASASSGAATRTQHFLILSNNSNGGGWVASRGPIHALGKDVVVTGRKDRFVYPNGTLVVLHHHVGKRFQHIDAKSCLAQFGEHGVYKIVRGTGAYKGVTGSGTYRAKFAAIGCHPKKKPALFQQQVRASGPLSL